MRRLLRSPSSRPRGPRALYLCAALWWTACGGGASGPETVPGPGADFSSEAAWVELELLTAPGPRLAGSDAAAAARRRILERLAGHGVSAEAVETIASPGELGPIALTHVVATLPGASSDRFVLAAPYDSGRYEGVEFVGANEGASGAAVLLELARVLAHRELPYTVQLVWLEGEGRLGLGEDDTRELRWLGSHGLAERWAADGRLDGIRLLVAIDRVCDADLRIARDLGSHRTHREQFWRTARRLGRGGIFSRDLGYESVGGSHVAFRRRGVRPVVALADTAFGGDEPPGVYAGSAEDVPERCAPESLGEVGVVTAAALDAIGARLAKIDRFARVPSVEPQADGAAEPAPESADAAEPAPEGEDADAAEPAPESADADAAEPAPEGEDADAAEPAPEGEEAPAAGTGAPDPWTSAPPEGAGSAEPATADGS